MQTLQNNDSKRERVKRAILCRQTDDIVPWQVNYTAVYKELFEKENPGVDIETDFESHMLFLKYKKKL